MFTDAQLVASLESDPFHAALALQEASGPQPCPFTVADMLDQLFPSAGLEPSPIWSSIRRTSRASFRPGSTQARTYR